MTLPLEDIVVVDLTRLLPGPFATQLFADLGAEVIKVEDPLMGDYMRFVPPTVGETSYPFLMVNRNKKSCVAKGPGRRRVRSTTTMSSRGSVIRGLEDADAG